MPSDSRHRSPSRSDSGERDRHRRRHRDRSRSRDHRRHRHRDDSRSKSRDRHRKRDRSESSHRSRRRDRSRSRHDHRSESRSKSVKKGDQKQMESKKVEVDPSVSKTLSVIESGQFLLPLKSDSVPKRSFHFDDRGREINEFGEIMETKIVKPLSTLAINRKQQQKSQINPYLSASSGTSGSSKPKIKNRFLIDPRIKISSRDSRGRNALNFLKEGTYTKRAEEMRNKAARALMSQQTLAEAIKSEPAKTEESEHPDADTPMQEEHALPPPSHNPVPVMEWWDYDLLPAEIAVAAKEGKYDGDLDYSMVNFDNCITKDVVEHPVTVERNKLPPESAPVVMYTKKERKKNRRLERAKREERKRDMILSGAIPAPEPKLTYRNFKQVLGIEALMHPTEADQKVRDQIEKRKLAHQLRNEERKLTPQQAAEKKEKKIIGDKNGELEACLFRLEALRDKRQRFKVSVNASQYRLVGRCLIVPSARCVMVYVEGTKKAIRHYVKLMTHRIKWNETLPEEKPDENNDAVPNACALLWSGMIKQYHFKEFMMMDCDSDLEARKEMEDKSLVQHWDAVVHYTPETRQI